MKHHVYGTELKNLIERFIQYLKDRTDECFDDYFPCRKKYVIGSIFGIGLRNYLYCTCIQACTECGLLPSWLEMEVKVNRAS